MRGHDPRAIANEILKIGRDMGISFSMMKLIKLVYFAHGWHLALTGEPLSSEKAEAWQYGPVFRSLYYSLPYTGSDQIRELIRDENGRVYKERFSDYEHDVIERVIDTYGHRGAFNLSDLTHEPDSPWDIATRKDGYFAPISDKLIQDYFFNKRRRN